MDFQWEAEQRQIYDVAQQFAQTVWAPEAARWDKEHIFPRQALKEAANLGFGALCVDPEYGGSGVDRLTAALVFEALSEACVSTAAYLSIHNMVAWIIDCYGNEEQRKTWLLPLTSFDILGSYCLTEPQSGSDAAALGTAVIEHDDHFEVHGAKAFISGGSTSDIYLCMVRTSETNTKGISCMLIDKSCPGIRFGELESKLGWHSQPTTMVFFDGCRVPKDRIIGTRGDGFKIALQALNGGRINIGACSLGGARACLASGKRYLSERQQFGQSLQNFQALQFRMADMLTEWEAARLMVYRAADALDKNDQDAPMRCAMAKRYASDVGFSVSDQVLQLFGGYGYLQDYPIERYFRDLRVHRILEGTNEIMRIIVAREIFKETFSLF